jgi:hypothetical protein
MATTLEEELSPPCLDDVADYFSLAEEEAEFYGPRARGQA